LQAKDGELDPVDDRLLEDLFRSIVKTRRNALTDNINELRFLQEDAQQSGDLRIDSYKEMVHQYTLHLRNLDQARIKQNGRRKESS
jgi:hypothetical protein